MSARFLSNLAVLVCGLFLLVFSVSLSAATVGWLALSAGCAVLLVVLAAFAVRGRGLAQRVLDPWTIVVAAWTIVASRAFTGSTLRWLSFSEAVFFCSAGLAGLCLHEALVQRELRTGRGGRADRDGAGRADRDGTGRTDRDASAAGDNAREHLAPMRGTS